LIIIYSQKLMKTKAVVTWKLLINISLIIKDISMPVS